MVSTECIGLLLNGAAEEATVSDLSRGQMAAQRGVRPLETIMSPLLFDLVHAIDMRRMVLHLELAGYAWSERGVR